MTDIVWKKSYLRKSRIGLYDGIVHQAFAQNLTTVTYKTDKSTQSCLITNEDTDHETPGNIMNDLRS